MALQFFPRGGSAHVARALARRLPEHGCDVTLLSGSLAPHGDARSFYRGLDDLHVVDFAAGDAPMHPSYEDRPGAPDPVFARLDDAAYEHHVVAWAAALERAGAAEADVLHLHHLTPINEAAARVAPGVPVVGHLHGTELLMLEQILDGPPAGWTHARAWADRMRRWAQDCKRLVVLTPSHVARTSALLGVDPGVCVVAPNGFDPETFAPRTVDRTYWTERLGVVPRSPVVIYVGRFTAVKRVPLLVRAWGQASKRFHGRASLVLVGGHPSGEVEGEHPADVVAQARLRDVHLAGWMDHDELPTALNAADALVLPSVREQFGAVLVEAMACGLPTVAVNRFGPSEIVEDGRTGWLVEPDDEADMARALVRVVNDPQERRRRGAAARRDALERWSWPALAGGMANMLEDLKHVDKLPQE